MSTLLLRIKGPMQSWGISSKFDTRTTERAPSKSAIVGMIAGALGRRRNEPIDDLNALRFGVRIDDEGKLMRDFQTALAYKDSIRNIPYKNRTVTNRYYLADAAFLVGLEGDDAFLEEIRDALLHPYFPLFLGRRSCPPEGRIVLGLRHVGLMNALQNEPWLNEGLKKQNHTQFQYILDAASGEKEDTLLRDRPLSFNQEKRAFGFRRVVEITRSKSNGCADILPTTEHDPMAQLDACMEEDENVSF